MSPLGDVAEARLNVDDDSLGALLLDLVGFDTQNPPGETDEAFDYVESYLAALDVETRRVSVDDDRPNLLATVPGERPETLLFNGHLDTVPYDAEEWTRDPLGERVDDRVYGRGTTDMKGAVAAMLYAIRGFATAGAAPPVTLAFAFVSDEETGGEAGLRALLDADALSADACVIGETTCERDRHSVTVADRGSIWLTLEAEGAGAHGSRPVLGVNAIDRLHGVLVNLRRWLSETKLHVDPDVDRIVDESVEYYAPTMGEQSARRLFEYPTVNLGVMEGGSAVNSVPETARARLDVRLTAGVDTERILAEIRECLSHHEGVELTDVSWSVGTAETGDSPIVEATVDTAAAVVGDRIYRRSATGGGDAKKLRNAGIPTVEFGLGTDTAHAVDEYTTVDALTRNAAIFAALPDAFAERLRD